MPETKCYDIKGKHVIFREMRHCIHSNTVKKKQGNRIVANGIHQLRQFRITAYAVNQYCAAFFNRKP